LFVAYVYMSRMVARGNSASPHLSCTRRFRDALHVTKQIWSGDIIAHTREVVRIERDVATSLSQHGTRGCQSNPTHIPKLRI
jgi:hypothetical protein